MPNVKNVMVNIKSSDRLDNFVILNLIDIKKSDVNKRKSKNILDTVRA